MVVAISCNFCKGLVIGASARFYSSISIENSEPSAVDVIVIEVCSVQFHQTVTFAYNFATHNFSCISDSTNIFIEKCVFLVLSYLKGACHEVDFRDRMESIRGSGKLKVILRADNDFYSQIDLLKSKDLPLLSTSLKTVPRFQPCPRDALGKVIISKTGMGSSAALTTSLVGAFLQYFNAVDLGVEESEEQKKLIHNMSQLVHAVGMI